LDARTRNSIIVFLSLTFGLSSLFYAWSFSGAALTNVTPLLMWMPGVAAVVTQLLFHHTLSGLGWRVPRWRYIGLAVLIPFVYCLAVYVPVWLTGVGGFNPGFLRRVLPLLPVATLVNVLTALGEEIGWRGFLTPALYRARGFAWAGPVTGFIWGLWHVPLIAGGGYEAGTPFWYGASCFMVSVTSMGLIVAWLRLRSASVWPAACYHGAHNILIQGVFDGSTIDTGATKWITTEFGVGLTIVCVAMGVYFWRRRGELPAPSVSG
jgi:membrane protease YdiL (CAAX protease family)